MKSIKVTMVRVYCTEGEGVTQGLLKRLHDDYKVRGVTVFRGIAGFGRSGEMHSSSLLDLSLDLPETIEFFDEPGRVAVILDDLASEFAPGHIITWPAEVNI
jgi:PII-like signaling protein